jgi:transposase
MDIVGIDISKATFDAALLPGEYVRHAVFSNTEAAFQQLLDWLTRHRPNAAVALHVCMEATGNWGLELADFMHAKGARVSVINPARIKAYGASELARNKTDKLDAGLIARFCRAQIPPAWVPPAAHLRELRELVRRCDALKAARVQELNRQKAGFASPAVAHSTAAHLDWLDAQIEAIMDEVRQRIATDPCLRKNLALLRSITGLGEISATILLAELPNIADFTPKALAAFVGLRPASIAPERACVRQAESAASGRGACAPHFTCALSAQNGPTNNAPPSFRK